MCYEVFARYFCRPDGMGLRHELHPYGVLFMMAGPYGVAATPCPRRFSSIANGR